MSKIGQQPVEIKDGVDVQVGDDSVNVKGTKGQLEIAIPEHISVKKNDGEIEVIRESDVKAVKAMHGLTRSLLKNAVHGVSEGWEKKLEVVGTGFKVRMQGADLLFDLGLSHQVTFPSVDNIQFTVDGNIITVSGVDKQLVGEVAHKIRSIKKPDAYKGKGIRYEGEVMHLKPGKKAATTEGA